MRPPTLTNRTCVQDQVGPVFVLAHLHGDADDAVDAVITGVGKLAERHSDGVGLVLVLRAGAKPPGDEARRRVVAWMRAEKANLRVAAVLMTGQGFWASAVRSVLSLVSLMSGLELKIFAHEDDVVHHVRAELGDDRVDAAELSDVIRSMIRDGAHAEAG